MSTQAVSHEIETTQASVVELFTALCGAPDDAAVAAAADGALLRLDALLAASPAASPAVSPAAGSAAGSAAG